MFRKKKIHSTKAHRYISFMIMANPSKSGKVITFPKWGLVAIMVLILGAGYGAAKVNGYVGDLKYNSEIAKQDEALAIKTNNEKQTYIDNLEQVTNEQEKKLQEIKGQAEQIKEEIEKIKAMKEDIDEKLGNKDGASIDSTNTEVASKSSEGMAIQLDHSTIVPRTMELTTVSAGVQDVTEAEFNKEYQTLKSMLDEYSQILLDEQEQYNNMNQQVDELLPYLAAKPTGYPLSSTYVTSSFGNRKNPFNKRKTEFHSGMDFKAYYKQNVMATGRGTVISAKYDGTYGYCVVIDHGYGLKTRYAHNAKILVKVGTVVERGTVISLAGSTGRSTGTHLHYEVLLNGKAVNPKGYLD